MFWYKGSYLTQKRARRLSAGPKNLKFLEEQPVLEWQQRTAEAKEQKSLL